MSSDPYHPGHSTWQRRFFYGLNVSILVLALLAIVVLANWITYRHAPRWTWGRIDVTATRAYSLSPQTRQILGELDEPIRIVTLFPEGTAIPPEQAERISHFQDVLVEYEIRTGGQISVEQINPGLDLDAFEAFAGELRERFREELERKQNLADRATALYADLRTFADRQSTRLTEQRDRIGQVDPQMGEQLQRIARYLDQIDEMLELTREEQAVAEMGEAVLPNYPRMLDRAGGPLRDFREQFGRLAEQFDRAAGSDDVTPAVREALERMLGDLRPLLDRVGEVVDALEAAETGDYGTIRRGIYQADSSAVVMSEGRVTVIRLRDVYPQPLVAAPGEVAPEQRFRGEEAITAAIVSLTREVRPMVVFVSGTGEPATTPGATFGHVAQRLRNLNFEVREWSPAGRRTQFGPMQSPKPEPAEGQPVAWVFLPPPPIDMQNPAAMQGVTQFARAFEQTLESGDPVLAFVALSVMPMFGQPDPIAEALLPLGIDARTELMTLTTVPGPGQRQVAQRVMPAQRWPADHPISNALRGQQVTLAQAVPLALADEAPEGVQHQVLLETGPETWAERDWATDQQMARRNDDEPAGPFPVALALTRDEQRLIVIGDEGLASNGYIVSREPVLTEEGLTTIERVVNPGNAELFVSSVYWLAGMEDLIATGARTQEVRRIAMIDPTVRSAMLWAVPIGLAAIVLGCGGMVWLVRRR